MDFHALITDSINAIIHTVSELLVPCLLGGWILGVVLRALVTFTIRRELWFAKEFEKRTFAFLENQKGETNLSFYVLTKKLLEKTYYELFEVRGIMKRRRPDAVAGVTDRIFLIQNGCARIVNDTLKQIRFLRPEAAGPKLHDVAASVYEFNPCFRRVFGIIPVGGSNDLLGLLPSLFIIGGIFGTFLGIMKALPELGGMDMKDIEGSKQIMDTFLVKVAYSMATSVVGIFLSTTLSLINTFFSAERPFLNAVQKFHTSLDVLWHRSKHNEIPEGLEPFDEHKDPIDALASEAVKKETDRKIRFVSSDSAA